MDRIGKTILYLIFILPVLLLLGFFFWSSFFDTTTGEVIRNRDLTENFEGKVDSLYFDRQNHNIKIALLSNGYKYEIFRQWEPKIRVGDSISKKKGSFEVIIYKGNNRSILDYRDTYRK